MCPQFHSEVRHPEGRLRIADGQQSDDNLHVKTSGELSCARAAASWPMATMPDQGPIVQRLVDPRDRHDQLACWKHNQTV